MASKDHYADIWDYFQDPAKIGVLEGTKDTSKVTQPFTCYMANLVLTQAQI